MKLAIVGAGWAGLAAAVLATAQGHQVTVMESARTLGGRARAMPASLPDGRALLLDNGQHILIGAYTETLALMQQVGVDLGAALRRQPLAMQFPDGSGLALPDWPAPLDALAGMLLTRSWPLRERLGLLAAAVRWRLHGFVCAPDLSVAQLCARLGPQVRQQLIEPLCVSALNTPAERASAQVFLRVLQDAMFGVAGGSHLLLPQVDLGRLFPTQAAAWLQDQGAQLQVGRRVQTLQPHDGQWQVDGQRFDAVLLAASSQESARLAAQAAAQLPAPLQQPVLQWVRTVQSLQHEAIATVYAWQAHARLSQPMLALHSSAAAPAQFVFDRGQLGGPAGLLAFVVSASEEDREHTETRVLQQARAQLALELQPVQTVVEKRATFACTPQMSRPGVHLAPGLLACGDYVDGPYPATLEGAVRSARHAVGHIGQARR